MAPSLAVLLEHRLGGLSAISDLLASLHRYNHLPSRGGDAQQTAYIPVYRVRGPVVGERRPLPKHTAHPLGGMRRSRCQGKRA